MAHRRWVWGPGGWLATTMGWFNGLAADGLWFRDFAGSTVVHTVGGTIALWGAIILGPRLGRRFKRDGGGPLPPHDLNIAAIGAVIPAGISGGRLPSTGPSTPPEPVSVGDDS